jgi:uncharacterized protein YecT (DUF1311 family)
MKNFLFVLLLFLCSISCHGQQSKQLEVCLSKAKAQSQINVCSSDEAARADDQLNEIYQRLLSEVNAQPDATAKIRAAERAWITYRDSYIDAMYPAAAKQAEYGSIFPAEVNLLRARLTQRQIVALYELLKQYSVAKE